MKELYQLAQVSPDENDALSDLGVHGVVNWSVKKRTGNPKPPYTLTHAPYQQQLNSLTP